MAIIQELIRKSFTFFWASPSILESTPSTPSILTSDRVHRDVILCILDDLEDEPESAMAFATSGKCIQNFIGADQIERFRRQIVVIRKRRSYESRIERLKLLLSSGLLDGEDLTMHPTLRSLHSMSSLTGITLAQRAASTAADASNDQVTRTLRSR